MMKVRGQMICGDPTPEHYQYPDIEEANQKILELEEKLYVQGDEIEQSNLNEEFYKRKISLLEIKLNEKDQLIRELIEVNKQNNDQIRLMIKQMQKERATSYYQMLTSTISTAACVITMYFGIKNVMPSLLGWKNDKPAPV